jgi:hypothetical protein
VQIVPATPERRDSVRCGCRWWRRRTGDDRRNPAELPWLARRARDPGLPACGDGSAIGRVAVEASPYGNADYLSVPSMVDRLGFELVRRAGAETLVRFSA